MTDATVNNEWNYQDAQTATFEKAGAFFAFSDAQLNKEKVDSVQYVSLGGGLICPKEKAQFLVAELSSINAKKIKLDLEKNGITKIIWRELANYETQIINDYSDVVDVLKDYGITEEQVKKEWPKYFNYCIDNDLF